MKRLLLAAAGLSVIAGPMAASAQSQPDLRDNHKDHQNARQAPANRPENRPAPQTSRAPPQNVQRFQQAPSGAANGNPNAHTTWRGAGPNGAPVRVQPNGSGGQYQRYGNTGQVQTNPGGQYQRYGNTGQVQTNRGGQYQRYGNTGQVQTNRSGQYQYRNGGQYQARSGYQNYRNWSGGNVRLSGDWWRGRTGFNGYYGRRQGYWFAPGWGYYQVDPQWLGFNWAVGAVVPYQLQSYYISDPYEYGLPPAPYGCEWIFLGDQIVLIDLSSGAILEIAGAY
ncbi:MAG TPA: RcnB family protein [Caulobacteraceae bacterium]